VKGFNQPKTLSGIETGDMSDEDDED